jgi:hypothetical protein
MQKFADSTATASDKSTALKAALDALNPDRTAGEAIAHHNELVRQVAEKSNEAADATKGFGDSLGGIRGIIEGTTSNGSDLRNTLKGIVDATVDAAASNADMTSVTANNQAAFSQLAQQYGVDIGTIQAAADRLGLSDVNLVVKSSNAGDVTKELLEVQRAYEHVGAGEKTITLDASQVAASRDQLTKFGFQIQDLPNGQVRLTATDAASPILQMVTAKVLEYDGRIGVADIDINKTTFDLKDQEALGQLQNLRSQVTNPQAGLLIDKLLQGKAVSMSELEVLNGTIANPKAEMDIAKIMEKLGLVNAELDRIARERTARITVTTSQDTLATANSYGGTGAASELRGTGADGGFRAYAAGGINNLPKSAMIQNPKANLVQWAEPETGGEAFIPLAPSKRKRSLEIWQKTGQLLGAPFQMFANGGIRASDFDELANGGFGASRPLTGAPYDWAGINWGDCSGAMSAFANLAAGLPVFGSRFATASEAGELAKRGAQPGRGGPGDLIFGWLNGGPGGGHTAGILPSGKAVEMGGSNDGGMYGGNPNFSQFTDWAHFPASMFGPSWTDPGSDPGGFVTRPDGTVIKPGDADYSASGSGSSSSGTASVTPSDSLSDSLGNAAGAFVKGQVGDLLNIFSIPDNPAALSAYNKYTADTEARKKQWDEAKKSRSDLESEQRSSLAAPANISPTNPTPSQVLQDAQISYDPGKGAEQWRPYVDRVLGMLGLGTNLNNKVIEQIDIESGGDPNATNPGYTAGGGNPSGLLQALPDTFNAFKSKDLADNIFDPLANIFACSNYAQNDPKYAGRGIAAIWPTTAGYADGGPITGFGGPKSDKVPLWGSNGEFMHTAEDYKRNKWAVHAIHNGATLEPAMAGNRSGPAVTYNIQAGNTERAFNEAQRLEKKRAAIGLGRF